MNAVITDTSSEALPTASPINNLAAQGRRLGTLMILTAQTAASVHRSISAANANLHQLDVLGPD